MDCGRLRQVGPPPGPLPRPAPSPGAGSCGSVPVPGVGCPDGEKPSPGHRRQPGGPRFPVSRGAVPGPGRAALAEAAPAARPGPPGAARPPLCPPYRGLLPRLDPPLHLLSQETSPPRHGRCRGGAVPHRPGGPRPRLGQHAKPGAERPGVPVSASIGDRPGPAGRGAGAAAETAARGAGSRGSRGGAATHRGRGRRLPVDGPAALRLRSAAAGMLSAACQGRPAGPWADRRARRQGEQGSSCRWAGCNRNKTQGW